MISEIYADVTSLCIGLLYRTFFSNGPMVQIARPICTHDGLDDAVWPMKVLSLNFVWKSEIHKPLFPAKSATLNILTARDR